ncbi:MAG: GGDEF domain-containing protein [Lachnospiraceae bacterium]|nr:GGDEF domain-containing protein [Lachnospiraceae bacterium]
MNTTFDNNGIRKITYTINTVILFIVFALLAFFYFSHMPFLVWFSLPTALVYLIGYLLIYKNKLYAYVCMVYSWLTLYMFVTTICLGYNYGFHLYSLSMIPIIYYTKYMGYRLNMRSTRVGMFAALIILAYLGCTFYVAIKGPVYESTEAASAFFWISNSLIVFSFLIYYTRMLLQNIISSEEKLRQMSYVDKLTGLYNRHYMMDQLERITDGSRTHTVAMIDIDDFKKINDVYGHNAGDYVLKKLSDVMSASCPGAVISRWGGEEFLLLIGNQEDVPSLMEQLRGSVEAEDFSFEGSRIRVTITIGLSEKEGSPDIDKWIQEADNKLYIGKKNGKNVVIT